MEFLEQEPIERQMRSVPVGKNKAGKVVKLDVYSSELGLAEDIKLEIPLPQPPPGEVQRDARGQIIKNADGSPKTAPNTLDPDYIEEVQRTVLIRQVAMVVRCLRPGQLRFTADGGRHKTKKDYWEAVFKELRKSGITPEAIDELINTINEISVVTQEEAKAAKNELVREDEKGNPTTPSSSGDSELAISFESAPKSGVASVEEKN